ncbi:MAG: hypothetical protein IIC80_09615, partial [Chloroflexi bacterium]|nr:hypothetical protein [Chloroflexota bacterium]
MAVATSGSVPKVRAAVGGPVVLMGIDAEDGGPGAHGPISVYESVITSIFGNVTNAGSGILVLGAGKSAFDDPTTFWNQIGTDLSVSVTLVNGATNITNQSFAGFAIVAVVSDVGNTPLGGLTNAENNAISSSAIAAHVNGGGGLFGAAASGLTSPYGYLSGVGAFTFNFPPQYDNITGTAAGMALGIDNPAGNLDICCWHDEYITFPSFLGVLATNNSTGSPAAIGGTQVVIQGNIDLSPATSTNTVGTNHTVTATAQDGSPLGPAVGVTVTFTVLSGPNMGASGTCTV